MHFRNKVEKSRKQKNGNSYDALLLHQKEIELLLLYKTITITTLYQNDMR
jgi:hypothetical protein